MNLCALQLFFASSQIIIFNNFQADIRELTPPKLNEDFRNILIVDNLPSAPKDKIPRLSEVLKSQMIKQIKERNPVIVDVHIPVDANSNTMGY
jgi:hypothetical protein